MASLWDGSSLKCTFRRMGDERMMEMWEEVVQIASTIKFNDSEESKTFFGS